MAAAYEEFLKRIQEGLKKEEEEKIAAEAESKKVQDVLPNPSYDPPPELEDDEEEELPTIVPEPEAPHPQQKAVPRSTSLKILYEEICDQIRAAGTLDIIMNDFQTCKTDLDRVTYVSQLTELENLLLEENYAQKNHEDACNYENVYDLLIPNEASASKALDVMKKCIQKTPPDETSALAVRYMKRGWAFLLLEQFSNAMVDAKKSLSFGCSEQTLWNSHEILGHANAQLKDYKQAEYHFLKSLENLRKSNTANEVKATVTVRIMTVFKSIKSKKSKKSSRVNNNENDAIKVPQIAYGVHKSFPSASAALGFVNSKEKGRCVIAKRDLRPGDVLMVDSPYCSMFNPDFLATHCYNCYGRAPVPIPCSSCAKVWYCSEDCRATSWSGLHSKECTVLNHLIEPGTGKMALLSFRVLQTLTWSKLQKLREKIEKIMETELKEASSATEEEESSINSIEPMAWEGSYSPDNYMTVLLLSGNSTQRTFGDLFKRAITAVYLTKCLQLAGYFPPGETIEEDLLFVASVILRHLQGSSCNAYEIAELELGPNGVVGSVSNEVGGALYTTVSLTNHACFCNTVRYSAGNKCILRAIRPIPKGAEVFDNYGFNYYLDTVNERREILINQYKFMCQCEACKNMWPMYPHHPTETLIFRCPMPNCGRPVCYSNTSRSKCNMCGNQQQYGKLVKDLEAQLTIYKDAINKLRQGNAQAALPSLSTHMEFLDCHAVLPIKHYSDLVEATRQCYNCLGNFHKPNEPVAIAEPQQQRSIKLKAGKNKFVTPKAQ